MKKTNWLFLIFFVVLSLIGICFIALAVSVPSGVSTDLDQFEHYSISSSREFKKGSRLKWSYQITNSYYTSPSLPKINILILTEDNYHLILENDSSAIINFEMESFLDSGEDEFRIPSEDTWVIVFNNTNQSFHYDELLCPYTIEMSINFYNLATAISFISLLTAGIILSFVIPIAAVNISSRKQTKLEEEKQQQEETREIVFSRSEIQERLDLLNSIMLHYDRLPTHILMHMLRFDSFRELMIWCENLPPELRFTYDKSEVVFLKDQTIKTDEKPIRQPIIENLPIDNKYLCSSCGNEVSCIQNKCPNCGEVVRCVVCKLQINSSEQICKCPLCETVGHLIHFHIWVDGINKCPFCRGKLSITDIVLLKE